MNYASILKCDIANGPGFRTSLFVSGCMRKCPGCFNEEAWNPNYGKYFDDSAKDKIFKELSMEYCRGLSLLGGDPMSKIGDIRKTVIELCREVKTKFTNKDIWLWTGYTFEEIVNDNTANKILQYIDVMVDGPFVESLKYIDLVWKGSSNQRVIDIKNTLNNGNVVLYGC